MPDLSADLARLAPFLLNERSEHKGVLMRPLNPDIEELNAEPPELAPDFENAFDEAGILADQDETLEIRLDEEDAAMGADGSSPSFGLEGAGNDFAQGDVDVKEQMDRITASADAIVHRPRDPDISPYSEEGKIDRAEAIHNGMLHREPTDKEPLHPKHGESTGAFTDIGAGRSGVTRKHK